MTKKVVLKVQVHDEKEKQKVMKVVTSLTGIESLGMDMKEKKLTVVGEVDPVRVVGKLRKLNWHTELVSVGPAKEPEKKRNDGDRKIDDAMKDMKIEQQIELYNRHHYPYYMTRFYHAYSAEDNPNSCVIF